ncbi:MAG: hypothetical protein H6834_15395 [Planctomycetes bacterium]|nr:hypothetical protein [Planctomycetota bacterium]
MTKTVEGTSIRRVLLLKVNAHRHGFDGRICEDATQYDCGAQEAFRFHYCGAGEPRCIHLSMFEQENPHFYIDQGPAQSVFLSHENEFVGDLAVMVAPSCRGGAGIDRTNKEFYAVGWYLVGEIKRVEFFGRDWWRITPQPGRWSRFLPDAVNVTRWRRLSTPMESSRYVRKLGFNDATAMCVEIRKRHSDLDDSLPEALERDSRRTRELSELFLSRLGQTSEKPVRSTHYGLPRSALETLKQVGEKVRDQEDPAAPATPVGGTHHESGNGGTFTGAVIIETPQVSPPPQAPRPRVPVQRLLREPGPGDLIRHFQSHGLGYPLELLERVYHSLCTKGFVLLAGPTGTGKTSLAWNFPLLFKDPDARRLLVAVQPSWRSREEVLGYYNPINETFVATALTRFLLEAETAYNTATRQNRTPAPYFVVLDEFNLAPPEEYLAEIFSRREVDREGRVIELFPPERKVQVTKNTGLAGLRPQIILTPNVFFFGTLNDDYSAAPLTARVLDRTHYVSLPMHVEEVFQAMEERFPAIAASEKVMTTIRRLLETLARYGRGFGGRVIADLMALCEGVAIDDEATLGRRLDMGVLQRVLPVLTFSALEPDDLKAAEDLRDSLEGDAEHLFLGQCAGIVSRWVEELQDQKDVSGQSVLEATS